MIIKPKYYGPQIPSTYAVNMTAAASGSNGITVANDADFNFGTYDFGAYWEGSLTSVATPATVINFFRTTVAGGLNSSIIVTHANTGDSDPGKVRVIIRNGATAYNYYTTQPLSALASANSVFKMVVSIVRETLTANGSISVYINGALLGSAITIPSGTNFVIGNAVDPLYISGDSASRVASNTVSFAFFNFAPTAAEVLDLCTNGIPESWKWGSQASAVSGSALNGTSTRAFSSFSGSSTGFVASNAYSATARMGGWSLSVTAGYKYRAKFDYTISTDSGTVSGFVALRASRSDITLKSNDVAFASGVTSLSGSAVIEVTATETGSFFFAFLETLTGGGAGNVSLTIANAEITRLGATMALLPDAIPTSSATTWSDTSGNTGGGTLPAAGATKVTIRK